MAILGTLNLLLKADAAPFAKAADAVASRATQLDKQLSLGHDPFSQFGVGLTKLEKQLQKGVLNVDQYNQAFRKLKDDTLGFKADPVADFLQKRNEILSNKNLSTLDQQAALGQARQSMLGLGPNKADQLVSTKRRQNQLKQMLDQGIIGKSEYATEIKSLSKPKPSATAGVAKSVGSGLGSVVAGVAGAAIAFAGLNSIVSSTMGAFDRIDKIQQMSDQLGIATDKIGGMELAFGKAGINQDAMAATLGKLNAKVSEAASGAGETTATFRELGLSAAQLNQMSTDDKFKATVDALAKVPNAGDRARLSMKLFEESGIKIGTAFAGGSKIIDEMQSKATKLGMNISPVDAAQVQMAKVAMDDLGRVIEGLWNRIAINLAPAITAMLGTFVDGASQATMGNDSFNSSLQETGGIWEWIASAGQLVYDVFKGVQAFILKGMSILVKGVDMAYRGVLAVAKLFTTIEPSDFLTTFAEGLDAEAGKSWSQINQGDWGKDAASKTNEARQSAAQRAAEKAAQQTAQREQEAIAQVNKPLSDLIQKYKEESLVVGLSSRQAEIKKAATKAVNKELLAQAEALDQQLTALEVAQQLDPYAQQRKEVERFNVALKLGKITQDQYNEAMRQMGASVTGVKDPVAEAAAQLDKWQRAISDGVASADAVARAEKQMVDAALGFDSSPFDTMADKLELLDLLFKRNKISQEDFNKAAAQIKADTYGVKLDPAQQMKNYRTEMDRLQKGLAKGDISQFQFNEAARDKLPDYIKSTLDAVESPLDKVRRAKAELDEWAKTNPLLQGDTYNRALNKIVQDSGLGDVKLAGVAEIGSREARQDVINSWLEGQRNDPQTRIADLTKLQLEENKETNRQLKLANERNGFAIVSF